MVTISMVTISMATIPAWQASQHGNHQHGNHQHGNLTISVVSIDISINISMVTIGMQGRIYRGLD
jgi:hypothetical protein